MSETEDPVSDLPATDMAVEPIAGAVPADVEAMPTGEAMEELLRLVEALVFASSVPVLPRALTRAVSSHHVPSLRCES